MEHVGIDMFKEKCCTKHIENYEIMSDDEIKNEIRNRRIAVYFLNRSNQKIQGKLLKQLRDRPTSLEQAFKLMQNHTSTKTHGMHKLNHTSTKTHGMHKLSYNKERSSSSDEEVKNKLQYTQKGLNIE